MSIGCIVFLVHFSIRSFGEKIIFSFHAKQVIAQVLPTVISAKKESKKALTFMFSKGQRFSYIPSASEKESQLILFAMHGRVFQVISFPFETDILVGSRFPDDLRLN